MRVDRTDIPALIVNDAPGKGRVAFLPADLDRQFSRTNNPDHAAILANIVRWLAGDSMPLTVDGPGQWDVNLYKQPGRFVLHVGSLNSGATHPPVREFIPGGPLRIRVAADSDTPGREAKLLVAGTVVPVSRDGRWIEFEIPQIAMHEVAVIS